MPRGPLIEYEDFRDDGGTPAWRQSRARGFTSLRGWYRQANPVEVFLAVVAALAFLLIVVPIATLLACYVLIP